MKRGCECGKTFDEKDFYAYLKDILQAEINEKSRIYNFDFQAGIPNPSGNNTNSQNVCWENMINSASNNGNEMSGNCRKTFFFHTIQEEKRRNRKGNRKKRSKFSSK